jgi:hypothetical protein
MQSSQCAGNIELYQGDRQIGLSQFYYDPAEKPPRSIVRNNVPGFDAVVKTNALMRCNVVLEFATDAAVVVQFADQPWNTTSACSDKAMGPITFVRLDKTLYREMHWIPFE